MKINLILAFLGGYLFTVALFPVPKGYKQPEPVYAAQVEETEPAPHTPTGCPYGDSIPLDSPKCVAPNPVVWKPYVNEGGK